MSPLWVCFFVPKARKLDESSGFHTFFFFLAVHLIFLSWGRCCPLKGHLGTWGRALGSHNDWGSTASYELRPGRLSIPPHTAMSCKTKNYSGPNADNIPTEKPCNFGQRKYYSKLACEAVIIREAVVSRVQFIVLHLPCVCHSYPVPSTR